MNSGLQEPIVKLTIEYWRIVRSYERNLPSLGNAVGAAGTIRNSEKKFLSVLLENGFRIMSYEGQDYSPNLPLTVVNHDEFTSNEGLIVSQMIEPTILNETGVVSMGKAILARKAE